MQGISPFTQADRKRFVDFISPMFQNTFTPRMQGLVSLDMRYWLLSLLFMGLLHQAAKAILMDKLADIKLCSDTGCSRKSKY